MNLMAKENQGSKEIDYNHLLSEISSVLRNDKSPGLGPGLLSGKTGIALFLLNYSNFSKESSKDVARATQYITEVFDSIKKGYNYPTFCDGISGYLWFLDYLAKKEFLDQEDVSITNELETLVANQMTESLKEGNIDFLHGPLGLSVFHIAKSNSKNKIQILSEFINILESIARPDTNDSLKWLVPIDEKGGTGISNGIAHGAPAIILALSKCSEIPELRQKSLSLLEKAVRNFYIIKNNHRNEQRWFPNLLYETGEIVEGNRLAWCYGDLSIAYSLLVASERLQDNKLKELSLELLTELSHLKSRKDNTIGICHGFTGISYLFYKAYSLSKKEEFKLASEFWINQNLIHISQELARFKSGDNLDLSKTNLINGFAGIGLVILTFMHPEISDWDECLLL